MVPFMGEVGGKREVEQFEQKLKFEEQDKSW